MERFFTLGKTSNFRHMGGYQTAAGATTRADRLYRSGYVNAPTAEVHATFDRLGIATVYDFRSPIEREKNPLAVAADVAVVELGMLVASVENLWNMLLAEGLTPAGAEKIMGDRYRELTREEIPGYRTMFQHMVENDGGALVMCSFGKDRAGIASALLLSALGVLPEQVEADYLLSAVAYADEDAAISKFEQFFSAQGLPVDREIVLPILDARPQYLNVAFDLIDREAGGMDRFLHTELGMGPAERELLVRRFTRPRG
ncbi:MAG: tyrosine-protein phosphatase [Gammaproteobacteria bacterium]|nr:tyrosine-protein phosphatase [Gammaproteobacteria bacterium]